MMHAGADEVHDAYAILAALIFMNALFEMAASPTNSALQPTWPEQPTAP
jgi:hypothetical protein